MKEKEDFCMKVRICRARGSGQSGGDVNRTARFLTCIPDHHLVSIF